jgi:hypothetical protein
LIGLLGSYAGTDELVEIARIAGRYGGTPHAFESDLISEGCAKPEISPAWRMRG